MRANNGDAQDVAILRKSRGRIAIGIVFDDLIILTEDRNCCLVRGANVFKHKLFAVAFFPHALLGDEHVYRFIIFGSREPEVAFTNHRTGSDILNSFVIDKHPQGQLAETPFLFKRNYAFGIRPHIDQQIAALGAYVDEHLDQLGARFILFVRRFVLPLIAESETGFPRSRHRRVRDVLLRRRHFAARHQTIRLQFMDELPDRFVVKGIEENHINGTVIRHQLFDLRRVVVEQFFIVGNIGILGAAAYEVPLLVQKIKILRRKIKSHLDAVRAAGIHIHLDDIFFVRRVHNAEIRRLGIPHAKSAVVFGGKDHVLDAGECGDFHPVVRIIVLRIKCFWQVIDESVEIFFRRPNHGVTDDRTEL